MLYLSSQRVNNLLLLGNSLQYHIPSKEQLENWFVNTDNNIGIITGKISSIFAIDIDGQETYEYFIQKIDSLSSADKQLILSIKDTMKIKTGSGNTNLIFRFNPEEFPHW